jgi:hypothetical protein
VNINERLTYVIKQFVKMIQGHTQSVLGVCKLQVLKDDKGKLILVDAKDIRFYDETGYLDQEGNAALQKQNVKIKRRQKQCKGLYCRSDAQGKIIEKEASENKDKSLNLYVLPRPHLPDYGQGQEAVLPDPEEIDCSRQHRAGQDPAQNHRRLQEDNGRELRHEDWRKSQAEAEEM